MKNELIAKVLKEARKQNALSVRDVVCKLEDRSVNVAEKTIYGWENGQSEPSVDTLLILCEIYNIKDIQGTFGHKTEPSMQITDFEKKLILNLRKHPEMLDAVKKLLDMD